MEVPMQQGTLSSVRNDAVASLIQGYVTERADPWLAVAVEELQRMRYFQDLLEQGFRHALQPTEQPDTLRTRRIALGIPLPELDLVPLWSRRAQDGTLSIPFIDFLLAQFLESVEHFRRDLREARRARAMLSENPTRTGTDQERRSGDPAPASLPILEDRYLPEAMLARLCGPRGVLNRILRRCENSISGAALRRRGPATRDRSTS
jgi:hypothetical protein